MSDFSVGDLIVPKFDRQRIGLIVGISLVGPPQLMRTYYLVLIDGSPQIKFLQFSTYRLISRSAHVSING